MLDGTEDRLLEADAPFVAEQNRVRHVRLRDSAEMHNGKSGTPSPTELKVRVNYWSAAVPRPSQLPRAVSVEHHPPPSTADLDLNRLRFGLLALVRDVRQDDLSLRELAVLSLLVSTPGSHTIRGFAAMLRVPRPAITRAVDHLELHGLAKRLPDPSDGRSVLVCATKRGFKRAKTIGAAFAAGET